MMPVPWGMRNHWEVKLRIMMRAGEMESDRKAFAMFTVPSVP